MKIEEVLTSLGYKLKDFGTHYRTTATFRGGNNPLSIAIRKPDGKFYDFATKNKGTFKELLALIMGDNPELIEKYSKGILESIQEQLPKQTIKAKKIYPPEVLLKLLPHLEYFIEKGISKETLKAFEVGLAHSGKLNRRYCFPIYNSQKQIIGFTGRWYQSSVPKNIPKWKHIGRKKEWVWPLQLCKEYIETQREVILVESPACVLHLWEAGIKNVLCLFGTDIGSGIVKYLLSVNPQRIIIATNNEPDNNSIGNNASLDISKKLLKYFDASKCLIRLPPKKDFAVCSQDEIIGWYNSIDKHVNF